MLVNFRLSNLGLFGFPLQAHAGEKNRKKKRNRKRRRKQRGKRKKGKKKIKRKFSEFQKFCNKLEAKTVDSVDLSSIRCLFNVITVVNTRKLCSSGGRRGSVRRLKRHG